MEEKSVDEKPVLAEAEEKPAMAEAEEKPALAEAEEKPAVAEAEEKPAVAEAEEKPIVAEAEEKPVLAEAEEKPIVAEAEAEAEAEEKHVVSRPERLINSYLLAFMSFFISALLIASPSTPWYQTFMAVPIVHTWIYLVHRLLHHVPIEGVWGYINTHMRFHHEFEKTLPRGLELFFECITDLSMNLLLLLIQYLTGIYIVPVSTIVLFTLSYMTVHIINYSIIGSKFHRLHHETIDKNFAPDALDHMFGTNYDDSYEDINAFALNAIWPALLLYPIRSYLWFP